jgi:hypothetical protein
MDTDLPDFAGEQSPVPETPPVQEPAPAPAPAPQEAPASPPEPAAQPEPPQEPAPAQPPPVPLATYLETREKLTAAEKEAKELREWRAQQEALARRQPPPSRDEDPEGFEAYRDQQLSGMLHQQKVTFSRRMAEITHGKDAVAEAFEWGASLCDKDPHFNAKVAASDDPLELVVTEWKRDKLLSKASPEDFDAFLAWKAAQAANPGQPQPAGAAPQPAPRPAAPRPSIAAAPSAGASADPQGMDGEQVFTGMFGT